MSSVGKDPFPPGTSARSTNAADVNPGKKAVFEPDVPSSNSHVQDDEDDESETNSIAGSDEWIGEDDRASDSIAPSVLSENDMQRHGLLMQQPPRSIPYPLLNISCL
jgi:hypothetical protein